VSTVVGGDSGSQARGGSNPQGFYRALHIIDESSACRKRKRLPTLRLAFAVNGQQMEVIDTIAML
jgi:hypothetical protein